MSMDYINLAVHVTLAMYSTSWAWTKILSMWSCPILCGVWDIIWCTAMLNCPHVCCLPAHSGPGRWQDWATLPVWAGQYFACLDWVVYQVVQWQCVRGWKGGRAALQCDRLVMVLPGSLLQ